MQSGLALNFASEELKPNVSLSVRLGRRMAARSRLQFASLELLADPEVVHAALAQNGIPLKFASDELRANPEVAPRSCGANWLRARGHLRVLKPTQRCPGGCEQPGCALHLLPAASALLVL